MQKRKPQRITPGTVEHDLSRSADMEWLRNAWLALDDDQRQVLLRQVNRLHEACYGHQLGTIGALEILAFLGIAIVRNGNMPVWWSRIHRLLSD